MLTVLLKMHLMQCQVKSSPTKKKLSKTAMLLAVIQHNNANEIHPKTCSVWGQVNPNIVLIGPIRHYWKHQQVHFCILANSCYEECVGMCMRANPNTRANLLILHLCSSFKLSLALSVLSYLISPFLRF